MKAAIKIIVVLIIAGTAGFYLGFRNRAVEVVIREPAGVAGPSTTTSVIVRAEELRSGDVIRDLFGENFQKRLPSLPWYLSRASAITAYLLMFIVIAWGAGMSTGSLYRLINPVEAWSIHKYLSISLGALVLLHMFSLLYDEFINFGVKDLFIPFASSYKPIYLALGVLAFYLLAAITLSSLVLRLRAPRLWRAIHDLTYPLFAYSFVHGVFIGTDAQTLALRLVYFTTGSLFLLIVAYRFISYFRSRKI